MTSATFKYWALHGTHPTEMLRSVVLSAARSRPSSQIPRTLLVPGFRFNSSQTPEERKAHNKAQKELQKDWAAPILTYEQVKQKSQQPSEVRSFFCWLLNLVPTFDLGCVFD